MQLNDNVLRTFSLGRVFKEKVDRINSIDFHRMQDLAVTAGDDDAIHLYDTQNGIRKRTCFSKKYGVSNINFTHHPSAVLYSSTKGTDHALRYLSMHDNKYLRYFQGHKAKVTSLCVSPKNDMFMSTSQDKSLRLWDLRTSNCMGLLELACTPTAAFDQQGLVFAVGAEAGVIKLYDARQYDRGPFDAWTLSGETTCPSSFSCLRFSMDGKLMVAVLETKIYLLDAYTGEEKLRLTNAAAADGTAPAGDKETGLSFESSLSPDGQYIASGCEDRVIRVWSTATGQLVTELQGHAGLPLCCKWAPRRMLLASACSALALWIPDMAQAQPYIPQQGAAAAVAAAGGAAPLIPTAS